MTICARPSRRAALASAGAFALATPVLAQSTNNDAFYRGKTIRVVVGTAAGAGYDIVARLFSRHLAPRLPGVQGIVVENMVGAGSLTMLNYVAKRAAKDGTVIGLPLNSALLEQSINILSSQGGSTAFQTDKLSWLGSPCEEPPVFWVMRSAGIESFDELRSKPFILGASQPGADNYALGLMNQRLLGAAYRMVSGYNGTNDLFLAADRGEIQGGCSSYSSLMVAKRDWITSGKIAFIAQYGLEKLPGYEKVPTAVELAPDNATKEMFRLYGSKFAAAYPFMLAGDVPAERVAVLQAAFDDVMNDAAFAKAITEYGMQFHPVTGGKLKRLVDEANNAPDAIRSSLRKALSS